MMHTGTSKGHKKGKINTTTYETLRNTTEQVISIGDIVVKERQTNMSRKGGRLAKKREEHFFVVEEIMDNRNIALRNWNKNEIEEKSVPPSS